MALKEFTKGYLQSIEPFCKPNLIAPCCGSARPSPTVPGSDPFSPWATFVLESVRCCLFKASLMRQILQNLGSGETMLVDVPSPGIPSRGLLIRSSSSLVSLGTERMLIDFGKAGYLAKARAQPEKVKQVIQKVKTDGFSTTVKAVRSKLDQPIPLGYCNAGRVLGVGAQLKGEFAAGDRVVSNGGHAEIVSAPVNLCARIPENVSDKHACFTVLGAIGLQGIRLIEPRLGERVVVTGLGLIGLLAVQLLRANGCEVLGLDFDEAKCELARSFGAEAVNVAAGADPVRVAESFSKGQGVDAVLITASTKSNAPLSQAAQMCRKRGRVVLVGVVGNEFNRSDFYEKEISFQVSCSYGPGRYDDLYERHGQDYPFGFVRWTQQRNFEAILQLMASGQLDPSPLISHEFSFDEALSAYEKISEPGVLGIVLDYPETTESLATRTVSLPSTRNHTAADPVVGVVGAGNFTGQVLLPALAATGARLHTIASNSGVTGTHHGKKFRFEHSTTDTEAMLANPEINTLFITTRHGSHARLVAQGLRAGKHVFVEKPLALSPEQLEDVRQAGEDAPGMLMVGFNRRFAPLVQDMHRGRSSLSGPVAMTMLVNAGEIPLSSWVHDPDQGGGRLVGEACHFVDLLRFLAGSPIASIQSDRMQAAGGDTASISISFEDGSVGAVQYFANGHKSLPKERLELFGDGKVLQLDNFRRLKSFGFDHVKSRKLSKQDKGHQAEILAFIQAVRDGGEPPIPRGELFEVTERCFSL